MHDRPLLRFSTEFCGRNRKHTLTPLPPLPPLPPLALTPLPPPLPPAPGPPRELTSPAVGVGVAGSDAARRCFPWLFGVRGEAAPALDLGEAVPPADLRSRLREPLRDGVAMPPSDLGRVRRDDMGTCTWLRQTRDFHARYRQVSRA